MRIARKWRLAWLVLWGIAIGCGSPTQPVKSTKPIPPNRFPSREMLPEPPSKKKSG